MNKRIGISHQGVVCQLFGMLGYYSSNPKLKKRTQILFCFILILFSHSGISQKSPIKFGKVEIADLEMQYYEKDSTAPAVILCDYGVFSAETFEFTRTIRIKILKKEGYVWANRTFYFYDKTEIRGKTFNIVNGEIVKDKLKSESIFEERITEDRYAIRIAMPNVKVGSVIDIEISHFGMPYEWKFQEIIPVKRSELYIERTRFITYQKNFFGYEPLAVSTPNRWVAIDVPAFKPEPFINSVENYLTKFEFDIHEISIPELLYYKSVASTWEAVCKMLLESKYFGLALKSDHYLKKVADEIETNNSTRLEMLKAAYEHAKTIKWNEQNSLTSSSLSLKKPYQEKTGNSADINLILIQLLNRLDFDVHPLAISTRDNGQLSKFNPSINKLNYVIAHVKMDSTTTFLLDATDEFMPFGMLPERCINGEGRIIDKDKTDWIALTTEKFDKKISYYKLSLDDELNLSGKISYKYIDYGAHRFRKKYSQCANLDEYIYEYKSDKSGLIINDTKIESLEDINNPIKIEYDVKIENQILILNDKLYLNPMIFEQIDKNYFNLKDRIYPVDFTYPFCENIIIHISVPEGYSILELPKDELINLEDNSAKFMFSISNIGNSINITCNIDVDKAIYLQHEYAQLRTFYDKIIKKQSEPIIIQKN